MCNDPIYGANGRLFLVFNFARLFTSKIKSITNVSFQIVETRENVLFCPKGYNNSDNNNTNIMIIVK